MAVQLKGPMKASDLFVRALENEGVQYIFGLPGEENLDFVESLRTSRIKLIVTRHEQAAGFMAATVGRLTGKAGVALSTLGPGATNFTTSAAYGFLGAFPFLMITGQKPVLKSKQGAFQIVDMVGMMRPVTKYTKQIVHGGLVPSYLREAIRRAEEERPGAVHLELPEDVAREMVDEEECAVHIVDRVRRPIAEGKAIGRAVEMITGCKHPLLVVGAGANRKMTSNMLRQFVDQTSIPFCDTQMGKGVVDSRHHCYMGTAAISDCDYIHSAINHADLIIMVGHDIVEKPPFFMHATDTRKVIHINYFAAVVDQVYFPHLEVVGDIGNAIWQLKQAIPGGSPSWDLRYFCYVKAEMEKNFEGGTQEAGIPMTPPRLVQELRKAMPETGRLCLDNGLYKVWFARQYKAYRPNTLLLDNALATMGAGLPSALAAKLVKPQDAVVALVGDGGFMMNSQELITAVEQDLHITVLLLNDHAYGMIKWKQIGMELPDFGLDLKTPDFVKYAEAYGAHGYRISEPGQFGAIMQHCLTTHGVHLVELPIDYGVTAALQIPALKEHLGKTLKTPEVFFKEEGPPPSPATPPPQEKEKEKGKDDPPDTSGAKPFPMFLANKAYMPNEELLVTDKYTGKVAYKVALAKPEDIDRGIAAAEAAFPAMAALPSYQRRAILEHCVRQFQERAEELAWALCTEAGKPIKDSRGEVTRLIDTFQIAMEECTRIYGQWEPMDLSKRMEGFQGVVRYFPIGPISMVSPFNFPLNLAAHKIAPALAVGCPFVMKPASRTPIGALIIGEVLSTAPYLPEGAFSILPCSRDGADMFTTDDRFKLLTFTGSPTVGWEMKARAGKKKVTLELGGNAGVIMEDFRSDAELDGYITKLMMGGYYQSGQSCIHVQRLFARQDHYDKVRSKMVEAVKQLKVGDPRKEDTFVGPLIDEKEAKRIEEWVNEAVSRGGKVLVGGKREGAIYYPTLLENVPKDCRIVKDEAFAPVVVMDHYTTFKEGVDKVNDSKYGLQAGVFTHDMDKAWYAFEQLVVGGVVINHVPSIRSDAQPYGGMKESGLGREGVKYAIRDYCEEKVMMLASAGKFNEAA